MCHSPGIIFLSLTLPSTLAVQPVNRYFSAESSSFQPDLECLVGIDSADVSELYKVEMKVWVAGSYHGSAGKVY